MGTDSLVVVKICFPPVVHRSRIHISAGRTVVPIEAFACAGFVITQTIICAIDLTQISDLSAINAVRSGDIVAVQLILYSARIVSRGAMTYQDN
jgi:hypothetical protein